MSIGTIAAMITGGIIVLSAGVIVQVLLMDWRREDEKRKDR